MVQSTNSPQEQHNHSNNSVAYLKSDTINYFAQQAASTNLQLGRLPQERYDRQTSPNKQHDQSQLGYIFQEQHDQLPRPKSSRNNCTIWQEWPTNSPQKRQETTLQGWLSTQESSMIKSHAQKGGKKQLYKPDINMRSIIVIRRATKPVTQSGRTTQKLHKCSSKPAHCNQRQIQKQGKA